MRYDCTAYCDRPPPLSAPKPGGSVWPRQNCPVFTPRKEYLPIDGPQCWFCRYADFHLTRPVALEVGSCCWPEIQME